MYLTSGGPLARSIRIAAALARLDEGMRQALRDDPTVMLIGEDIGTLGGVLRITDGLLVPILPDPRLAALTFVISLPHLQT
jgi:2-oxoisovalerate dehydrogenase E1 component beta subunit